jgi:hypothetical protein
LQGESVSNELHDEYVESLEAMLDAACAAVAKAAAQDSLFGVFGNGDEVAKKLLPKEAWDWWWPREERRRITAHRAIHEKRAINSLGLLWPAGSEPSKATKEEFLAASRAQFEREWEAKNGGK